MFNVNGFRVTFAHIELAKFPGSFIMTFRKRDGVQEAEKYYSHITCCEIAPDLVEDETFLEADWIGGGESFCLHEDNFDKAFGRKKALTRALEDSGFDKHLRTIVWEFYWSMVKK